MSALQVTTLLLLLFENS